MSSDDSSPRVGSTRKVLGSLRNILFESTPPTVVLVSADVAPRNEGTDSDMEAARQVLRASIEAELGPGVREFALQNQALLEVLPDPALRRKAALCVLSLKGSSPTHLSIELDRALATLATQGEAFARKVSERRAALEASQRSCNEQYQLQTAEAERAMARLRAELDAHGVALAEALTQRDQALAESEASFSELSRRERGFQRAFHDLENEYQSLKAELAKESS